jgi:hypothetical protein
MYVRSIFVLIANPNESITSEFSLQFYNEYTNVQKNVYKRGFAGEECF